MKYEVMKCKGGWYWRIIASNGKIFAHSEVYKTKRSAERAAIKVKLSSMYAPLYVK